MRPAAPAGVASALAAALLLAPALPTGGTGTAAVAECTWQRQAKRVVKRVKREGRPRRVVRVRRWWSCRPAAVQPVPMPSPGPAPEPQPAPGPGPEAEAGPARLSVKAQEFSFTLSRPSLPAGEAIVELNNQGEDPHDLNLLQQGSEGPPLMVPEAGPLEHRTAKFDLAAGTYRLWCSLPQHDEWGMNATLTVTS